MEAPPRFDRPIAHRGLHDATMGVIENSATAFDRAISAGYAIECDLQLTGDDVPVVFHDETLARLTRQNGPVCMLSAGQLARIPLAGSARQDCPQRLEELLEQVAGRTLLVLELKHQQTAEQTRALAWATVQALKHYEGPAVIESFDPKLLTEIRQAGFDGPLGTLLSRQVRGPAGQESALKGFYLRHMLHWPQTRFSFISAHANSLDLPMLRFWRARGMPVTAWTITAQEQAKAIGDHADQIVFEGFLPQTG